ncbi:MAG: hypothetical protein F6J87_03615 [Spirulina sp. SIO3F2]|nr:hypothetical protein [Spirulina sp. SIO3F2]
MLNVFDCKDYIDFSVLVNSRVLVALYNRCDRYHGQGVEFLGSCPSQLVTTVG